jgi:hypothetical protein
MSIRSLLVVFAIAGCTHPHDVNAVYAIAPQAGGSLEVLLNKASDAMTIAVNDVVVVDRKFSRKAHVDGIPEGPAHVVIATGGGCEQQSLVERDVEITPGVVTSIVLPGPERNHGCMVYAGLVYVGLNIGILAYAVMAGLLYESHHAHVAHK